MSTYGPRPVDPTPPDPAEPSLLPTNKLLAAAITGVVLYGLSLVTDVDPQVEQAVNVIGPLIAAWIIKNASTGFGGVPAKK